MYGPKGAGALFIRQGVPFVPWLQGGGQESGRRSGTENVPAIVGLGKAAELARAEIQSRADHCAQWADRLRKKTFRLAAYNPME